MNEPVNTILCMPTSEMEPVAGCIVETCKRCRREIWLSRAGQAARARHNLTLMCVHCLDADDRVAGSVPGAHAEAAAHFRKLAANN